MSCVATKKQTLKNVTDNIVSVNLLKSSSTMVSYLSLKVRGEWALPNLEFDCVTSIQATSFSPNFESLMDFRFQLLISEIPSKNPESLILKSLIKAEIPKILTPNKEEELKKGVKDCRRRRAVELEATSCVLGLSKALFCDF
ncbi:hypothetical protein Q3G72_029985 [Acer saccharum]|nr:hypothetical protein Q3G72_029985 [Acer saccharum]